MCIYCKENPELLFDNMKYGRKKDAEVGLNFGIDCDCEEPVLFVNSNADVPAGLGGFMEAEVPINYCPMCGRKLKNE